MKRPLRQPGYTSSMFLDFKREDIFTLFGSYLKGNMEVHLSGEELQTEDSPTFNKAKAEGALGFSESQQILERDSNSDILWFFFLLFLANR